MTTDRSIQTSFVLQRDEFVKAQRLVTRHLPLSLRLVRCLPIVLLGMLMGLAIAYQPHGELQPISLLICGIVLVIFICSTVSGRMVMNLQFKRMDGKEIHYRFEDCGFTTAMAASESRVGWGDFGSVLESDTLFVLPLGATLFYIVPKRAFVGDDAGFLRQLLMEKLTVGQP